MRRKVDDKIRAMFADLRKQQDIMLDEFRYEWKAQQEAIYAINTRLDDIKVGCAAQSEERQEQDYPSQPSGTLGISEAELKQKLDMLESEHKAAIFELRRVVCDLYDEVRLRHVPSAPATARLTETTDYAGMSRRPSLVSTSTLPQDPLRPGSLGLGLQGPSRGSSLGPAWTLPQQRSPFANGPVSEIGDPRKPLLPDPAQMLPNRPLDLKP